MQRGRPGSRPRPGWRPGWTDELENDQIRKSSKSFNFWAKLAKSDAIERWMGSLGDRSVDQNYQKRTQTIDRSKIA